MTRVWPKLIFLPRNLPQKLTLIVKEVDDNSYEMTTEPKIDPLLFTTFYIKLRGCTGGLTIKAVRDKIVLSNGKPDFNAILKCLIQTNPTMSIELKINK